MPSEKKMEKFLVMAITYFLYWWDKKKNDHLKNLHFR